MAQYTGPFDQDLNSTGSPTFAGFGLLPPGVMLPYAGASAPAGYLFCDGAAISLTTYADLYAVIGVTYGDPGGGNFNIPDMRGRTPMGVGTGDAADATAHALADKDGTETHVLITAELAGHTHTTNNHSHTIAQHSHTVNSHTHTGPSHVHTMPSHVHTMGTHVHTMPSHSHTANSNTTGITAADSARWMINLVGNAGADVVIRPSAGFSNSPYFNIVITDPGHTHTTTSVDPGDTNATDPGDTSSVDPGDTNAGGTAVTGGTSPGTDTQGATATGNDNPTTNSSGSDTAHANMQPSLTVNFIIKT
jgi:microcystin-dependent protein